VYDPDEGCVPLKNRDPDRIFACIEGLTFYQCPMREHACASPPQQRAEIDIDMSDGEGGTISNIDADTAATLNTYNQTNYTSADGSVIKQQQYFYTTAGDVVGIKSIYQKVDNTQNQSSGVYNSTNITGSGPMFTSFGSANCKEGYEGIMCARCSNGYFKQSDDTCAQCTDVSSTNEDGSSSGTSTGSGDQNQAYLFYGVMAGIFTGVTGFVLHLYMRRDTGAAFVNRIRRCFCSKRKAHVSHAQGLSQKHTGHDDYAHEQRAGLWFRPEKFKILLAFVQIFAQMKNNYSVPWSPTTAEYMRQFGGFNIDIVKIAAVDCLYRTNFYFGLIVVIAVPVSAVIFIFLLHRFGKWAFLHTLTKMPRKCVRSGEDVTRYVPQKKLDQK
jgi:hypothetical protein